MSKSKYSFLIDSFTWSYSRVSSFEACPHGWKLAYIDKEKGVQNFFAEYGLFHHKIMELLWAGELDVWDLASHYEENYGKAIKLHPPSFLERYDFSRKSYNAGLKFYENFDWDISEFEVLGNEMTLNCKYKELLLTIRPDTLIKNKKTGKVVLVDYKASNPFNKKSGNPIKKKIAPYKKQLSLYCFFVEQEMNIKIDEYMLVFPKFTLAKNLVFDYNKEDGQKIVDWFYETICRIKEENDFEAKPNKFFCDNICSMRNICEHKE